jgi:hypothetical protein
LKEPKVPSPDKFTGLAKDFKNFKATVENVFLLQPSRFPTHQIKVLFTSTLLSGQALTWFRTLPSPPDTLQDLWTGMEAAFGDPYASWTARSKLKTLRQANQSCVTYTNKFKELAIETEYNDAALMQLYHDGLSDSIQDILAQTLNPPETLEEYTLLAIKVDNRLYSKKLKQKQQMLLQPIPSSDSMQVDLVQTFPRGPLSTEERLKRTKEGLCFYCGTKGHMAKECPKKKKSPNFQVQAL